MDSYGPPILGLCFLKENVFLPITMFNDTQGHFYFFEERERKSGFISHFSSQYNYRKHESLTLGYSKLYFILTGLWLPKLHSLEMLEVEHENGSYFDRVEK